MYDPFHEVLSDVRGTILKQARALDRPVIGVMPAYFPLELVYASGGFPVQLWGNRLAPSRADAYLQSYCCSVARSAMELELAGGADMVRGYAFTSLCDTLVNLREVYRRVVDKPTVELSIPVTQTAEARRNYLSSGLDKVNRGLQEMAGGRMTPESLAEASELYGRVRALQRRFYALRLERAGLFSNLDFYAVLKAGSFLGPEYYAKLLSDLLEKLDSMDPPEDSGPRLLLSGLVYDPLELHRILDRLGVRVVQDDFANGWRTVSKETLAVENLVEGVARYLFGPAPCCCLYNPENDRHDYLVDHARKAGADGVLFWYLKFCEPDAFDRPQLMKRLTDEGIPSSVVELELSMQNFDAIGTRLSAFCEMLEG